MRSLLLLTASIIAAPAYAAKQTPVSVACPEGSFVRKAELTYMDVNYFTASVDDYVTKELKVYCYNPEARRYVKAYKAAASWQLADHVPWATVFEQAKRVESVECGEGQEIESAANTDRDSDGGPLLRCRSFGRSAPRAGFSLFEEERSFHARLAHAVRHSDSDKSFILRDYPVLIFDNLAEVAQTAAVKDASRCLSRFTAASADRINALFAGAEISIDEAGVEACRRELAAVDSVKKHVAALQLRGGNTPGYVTEISLH